MTFIAMRPALEVYMTPLIGIVSLAVILLSWFGGVRYGGLPAGLVAIAVGSLIAWGSTALGFSYGGLSAAGLADSIANFGFSLPIPAIGHVFSGFEFLGILLVTAIPFGIYDLVEAMDNVESAEVAGDTVSHDARADGGWRHQPDRLHDGQSVHPRGLHRPSRLEGDGRQDRLLGGNRRHGHRLSHCSA